MATTSILILGAGRSSTSLISYLLEKAPANSWQVTVGDFALKAAQEQIGNSSYGKAILFDIRNEELSRSVIASSSVVISLLPAHLHPLVAKICLIEKKHLLTASYVSDEMKPFHAEALANGLLFFK